MEDFGGAFIVGTGRCGSTVLSRALRFCPTLLSLSEWFAVLGGSLALRDDTVSGAEYWRLLSEPHPDLRALLDEGSAIPELSSTRLRDHSAVAPILLGPLPHLSPSREAVFDELRRHTESRTTASIPEHHRRTFEHLARHFEKLGWVERSGGSLEYAADIRRGWPRAKFVHLWRDGTECALSMSRHPFFRMKVARAWTGRHDMTVADCLRTNVPLDRFGAYWSSIVLKGTSVLEKLPRASVLHVSFDALTERPRETLRDIATFLHGDVGDAWLDQASRIVHPVPRRSLDLRPEDRVALERTCKPGMRAIERLLRAGRPDGGGRRVKDDAFRDPGRPAGLRNGAFPSRGRPSG